MKKLLRLWPFARQHTPILFSALGFMLVLGAATGLYAYLMGPLLRFLLTGGDQGLGALTRWTPSLQHLDRRKWLWVLPLLLIGIGTVKGLAYLGQFYSMGLFGHRVGVTLRRAVFVRLSQLSPIQLGHLRSGDLLSRLTTDVAAVETAANYAIGAYLRDGIQVVVMLGVALYSEWKIALASLIVVPLTVVPAVRLTRSFLKRTREAQGQLGAMAAQVREGVQGIRTVQAFNARTAELARFESQVQAQLKAQEKAAWASAAVPSVMELFAAVAIAGSFLLASGAKGEDAERFVTFITALVFAYTAAKQLGRVGQMALGAGLSSERLFEILDLPNWVPQSPAARQLAPAQTAITLDQVSFAYGERLALRNLSLEIPIGKISALVGPSGGGKSTLTALLLRQARPSSGRILIDGIDVDDATLESVRAQFALVTQDPLLFSATVRENLALANPNATPQQLEAAAAAAQADTFIRALPLGYETRIGERGAKLSGGQKQRVALARALLANAPVLLLDEATSSLDPESEREVQSALATLLPGRTALVIAHRLSTIAQADAIHVVQDGAVAESGTHTQLLAQRGLYAQLWALQQSTRTAGGAA